MDKITVEPIAENKMEHEEVNFGGIWHSDTTYLEQPPIGALLLARELPPVGGDTLFANMYLAYDALSEGMKSLLDNLIVVQSSAKAGAARSREQALGVRLCGCVLRSCIARILCRGV